MIGQELMDKVLSLLFWWTWFFHSNLVGICYSVKFENMQQCGIQGLETTSNKTQPDIKVSNIVCYLIEGVPYIPVYWLYELWRIPNAVQNVNSDISKGFQLQSWLFFDEN